MKKTPIYDLPLLTGEDDSRKVLNTFEELMWDNPSSAMSKIEVALADRDVIEVNSAASLPASGKPGKVYVTTDDNKAMRWNGIEYVELSAKVPLGEAEDTAYRGDRGKVAYDHSQSTGNPHGTTPQDIGAEPAHPVIFQGILSSDNWTQSNSFFIQACNIPNVSSHDVLQVDAILSSDDDALAVTQQEEWGKILDFDSISGGIRFRATEQPQTALSFSCAYIGKAAGGS